MDLKNATLNFEDKAKRFFEKYRTVMFWTAVITFFTHIYFFVNRYGNEDSLFYLKGQAARPNSGRYFYWTAEFDFVPFVLFAVIILELLFSVILVLSMLKVKNRLYSIIIAAFMVTFPALGYSFFYMHMWDIYTLSLLFSVLAVYVSDKYKYGFAFGGFFLACSLALYQSYVTVSMGLALILLIFEIIEKDLKSIWKKVFRFLAFGIIGVVLYKAGIWLLDINLSDYKGLNSMGDIPINMIPELIIKTYKSFILFFTGDNFGIGTARFFYVPWFIAVVYVVFFIVFIYTLGKTFKTNRMKVTNKILVTAAVLVLPMALNLIDFVGVETYSIPLNIYAVVFIFIIPFVVFERYTYRIMEGGYRNT